MNNCGHCAFCEPKDWAVAEARKVLSRFVGVDSSLLIGEVAQALRDERERCAKICDEQDLLDVADAEARRKTDHAGYRQLHMCACTARICANAIRGVG